MELLSTTGNILLVIVGFGVLILVHEAGHFLAAKWAGIRTEAFAIGMGPVLVAWRRGVGLAFGSTESRAVARYGKRVSEMSDGDLATNGVGETEYSLRALPLGGFVKMLGQEDINPSAVSSDPRSYNRCPIGKRMVVVSAGVIMNLILAVILFIISFMVGVRVEAPVIGPVVGDLPGASVVAVNATEAGVTEPGLKPGDRVVSIDGTPARTFADLRIAAAMGRTDVPIDLVVERRGVDQPLEFEVTPRKDPVTGLLSIGVEAASGTTLTTQRELAPFVEQSLGRSGLAEAGVRSGMTLLSVNGSEVTTWQQAERFADASGGATLASTWGVLEPDADLSTARDVVTAPLPVDPVYELQIYPEAMPEGVPDYEMGLLGLVPLTRISEVIPGSDNEDVLRAGDIILRAGTIDAPRQADFRSVLMRNPGATVPLRVQRDGNEVDVEAFVNRRGQLGVMVGQAWDDPIIARPFDRVGTRPTPEQPTRQPVASAVGGLGLLGRSRLESLGDHPITDWPSFRAALLVATRDAADAGTDASVELTVLPPTPGAESEVVALTISSDEVTELHGLGWAIPLGPFVFDPVETVLTAEGSPLRAISMGFGETHKLVLMTYLTIDRLFRGSVGVEQLRGPVGIVHMGSRIADRGITYLLFFMAMISVNLAVLNFLPLPIVDGGLFLFLVYEKIKGRPPSIAFQNGATLAGLCLIGAIFVITFYNDVMRLL